MCSGFYVYEFFVKTLIYINSVKYIGYANMMASERYSVGKRVVVFNRERHNVVFVPLGVII